ncbi:hypothetical protein HDU91_005264 [Kappamyces sp. JEL0680]|nr:hypothetical protein HDU91_005264 [Kappamyces sp. JEL0680]
MLSSELEQLPPSPIDWHEQAAQVVNLFSVSHPRLTISQVVRDLQHSQSVKATINRIFDGLDISDRAGKTVSIGLRTAVPEVIELSSSTPDKPAPRLVHTPGISRNSQTIVIDSSPIQIVECPANPSSSEIVLDTRKTQRSPATNGNGHATAASMASFGLANEAGADDDDLSFLNEPVVRDHEQTQRRFIVPKKLQSIIEGPDRRTKRHREPTRPADGDAAETARKRREEKERKELEKLQRLHGKEAQQALKSVNVLRQRAQAAEELIVVICSTWKQESASDAVIQTLRDAGATIHSTKQPIPYSMTFCRKITREFDFDQESWKPCCVRYEMEPFVLLLLRAERLAELCLDENGVIDYFNSCVAAHKGHTLVFLVENLAEYRKKQRLAKNRMENDQLRLALGEMQRKQPQFVHKRPEMSRLEAELLYLQIFGRGRVKIHPCSSAETAAWILSFTQQIAMFPELYVRKSVHSCLNFGESVRSGKDAADTWRKMLEQIPGVTERVSSAILARYPTSASFAKATVDLSARQAQQLLMELSVDSLSQGRAPRSIGTTLAKRIVDVVLGLTPSEFI